MIKHMKRLRDLPAGSWRLLRMFWQMRSFDVAMAVFACALPLLPRAAILGPYTLQHVSVSLPTLTLPLEQMEQYHATAQA